MTKRIAFFIAVAILLQGTESCGPGNKDTGVKWSLRMASTVLATSDSLIHYVPGKPKWAYDVAFLGMAVDKLGDYDARYSKYLDDWVNYFVQPDGSVTDYNISEYNLDRIFPGRDVINVYRRHPELRYKIAIDHFVEQLKTHPRTDAGGYWHKKIYPHQMWLDGIFMASTFMAQYARIFDDPKWLDVATSQVKLIYQKTLDPSTGLLMHAWDESKSQKWCDPETGKSHYPWSRAMGWYVLAITDILDYLPENHPDRQDLIKILQSTCEALLKVKDQKTGLWYQVLDQGKRKGNYLEGSGSAMFIYVFAKGARLGYLDKKYRAVAESSFDGFIRNLVTVGSNDMITIHNICGGCGLGGNPYRDGTFEYYTNEKRVDNDTKGVAPFILAAIELNR